MRSPCGPPKFDQQDWSQFDFSRWHLDGIALDATSAAVAQEWRQHFKATLPALQQGVLTVYRGHSRQLQDEKTSVAQDFDERIAAAQKRSEEFGKPIEAAASPPTVQADPHTFHLAVKVNAGEVHGLPGVAVRMLDPRNPKTVLVQNVTDRDGNAILTVPTERAGELDKTDTLLEVRSPDGKSLQKLPDAVCIRLNQTDTKVITLRDAPSLKDLKAAALAIRSEREARARNLVARIDRLRKERQASLHDLDCRLEESEKIIAMLEQAPPPTPEPSGPASEQVARPRAEPSKEERSPASTSKKGRKRR